MKWEYLIVDLDYLHGLLDKYGNNGWELCSVREKQKDEFVKIGDLDFVKPITYYECIFKKPIE